MNSIQILLIIACSITLTSCNHSKPTMNLISGDIIFCSYQTGELSNAIDEVTQTQKATHYSHMGIIEVSAVDTFVIHASLKRGVIKETLTNFLRIDKPTLVDLYRLKDSLKHTIPLAIRTANALVGLPYNSHYLMNDSCYYCSQLIYEVFKDEQIFSLVPMTFKNPDSDAFNEGWIKHYEALQMEIPEDELGCNPNGLAASEKLDFIKKLNAS